MFQETFRRDTRAQRGSSFWEANCFARKTKVIHWRWGIALMDGPIAFGMKATTRQLYPDSWIDFTLLTASNVQGMKRLAAISCSSFPTKYEVTLKRSLYAIMFLFFSHLTVSLHDGFKHRGINGIARRVMFRGKATSLGIDSHGHMIYWMLIKTSACLPSVYYMARSSNWIGVAALFETPKKSLVIMVEIPSKLQAARMVAAETCLLRKSEVKSLWLIPWATQIGPERRKHKSQGPIVSRLVA